jgi:alpha-mannosidase
VHSGDWREARLPHRGLEFNTPVQVVATQKRKGDLGRAASLIGTGGDDAAILVALKKAEKSNRLVARLYDSLGRGASVSLKAVGSPVKTCRKVNITEDDKGRAVRVRDGAAPDRISPWEIATYAMDIGLE